MLARILSQQLKKNNYLILPSSIPNYSVFIKPESSAVLYLHVIDISKYLQITNEGYLDIKNSLIQETKKQFDMDGHIMSIVLYDDINKAKEIVGDDYFCWFVNKSTMELEIEDNRVEDFYGLKSELEQYLVNCRQILENCDMKEIEKVLSSEEKHAYKPPKRKPAPASIMILVLNLIMFSTRVIVGQPFIDSTGMSAELVSQGEIYRIITAMFMHANAEHLLSNMLILYFLGEMMEHIVGTPKVAAIYMLSGLFGNVVSYYYCSLNGLSYLSIGASGAVFGLMGAAVVMVIYKYEGFRVPVSRVILLVAFCVYSSFVEPNIDIAAHIGGLAMGLILAFILFRKKGGSTVEG